MANSKEYSWAWVTADRKLTDLECELVYAYCASDGNTTGKAILYDGVNTSGDEIVQLESPATNGKTFSPNEPVYCRKGLYVDYGTGAGVFVLWRNL